MSPDERRAEILELLDLADIDASAFAFALSAKTVAPHVDVLRRIRALVLRGEL